MLIAKSAKESWVEVMNELKKLAERFRTLESDINGAEPTEERCRDWAASLAWMCHELCCLLVEKENDEKDQA